MLPDALMRELAAKGRNAIGSWQMLRALPVPSLVLPGHPNSSREPQSPCLSRERWETMLDEGIHEMRRLVARYEMDGANFLDGRSKRLLPGLYYLGDFHDSAVYGLFTSSDFFVVDAPGGVGLAEFLKASLHKLDLAPAEPTAILLTACGERETAGLKELVERSHAQVVASSEGVEAVREMCPAGTIVIPASDLPGRRWFAVKPLSLRGRGVAPAAYVVTWDDRKVLISGRIPAAVDEQSREELLAEFSESKSSQAYIASLKQLGDIRPHLWLPAAPSNGQNANIYDGTWHDVLEKNYLAAQHALQSP